jgi:(1->4)-alpha-D-glucan 1-alpha-D-glucosylmutase
VSSSLSGRGKAAPGSTYRLQLGPDLTFAQAAKLGGYLAELGVSHAYLSPILTAAKGSTHGYDVVDHSKIDPDLGGARGFAALARAFAKVGIGVVVDVVPNHMAIPVPEYQNGALWSVLREGRGSSFAKWFDIDWDAEGDRILMPVLDGTLAESLENLSIVERGGQPELAYFDHRFPIAPGTETLPLPELVEAQHYLLADWRSASTQLNYRRFCDITSLIGLRVEDPAVFKASHSVLLDAVARGRIDGLRIDHPDGLADPAGYLADLGRAAGAASGAASDTVSHGGAPWVVVEKVLADGEPLPPDWPAAGTTGYETLTVINGLLVDPTGEEPLSQLYTELTGETADFALVADAGKRLIAHDVLATELARLTGLLGVRLNAPFESLQDALIEVFCCLDVYRPFAKSPSTVAALDSATRTALGRRPALHIEIEAVRAHALDDDEFGVRFGQTAAALYAKGVEDTAFYRHARLLSLNEVGGDPGKFGHSVAEFHGHASMLQSHTPTAMTTLSTHDTKRGEDVRARLAVLSEMPREWERAVRGWLARGDNLGCPDDRTGYFFWQTLVGAWPLDVERAARYMEKATREAKLTTSWQAPDVEYDQAVRAFVAEVFDDAGLLSEVEVFVDTLEPFARTNSLTQKLIQLTMPGVPDTYQGCELPSFTLVDPDNRRAVNFDVRRAAVQTMLDEKLRLTATALRLRRDHPSWFDSYQPIAASGPAADHAIAFSRSPTIVVIATRFSARLDRTGGWRDTYLALPQGALPGHTWVDALSGLEHEAGEVPLGEVLKNSPVALLVPGVIVT